MNPLSLSAYQAAYENGSEWLDQLQDYLDANFEFAVKYIRENIPGVVCEASQATYLLWVDMNGCGIDVSELSRFFAKSAGLLVESGNRLFVSNAAGFVRVNLAMPRAMVAEGLERMAAAVREEHERNAECSRMEECGMQPGRKSQRAAHAAGRECRTETACPEVAATV